MKKQTWIVRQAQSFRRFVTKHDRLLSVVGAGLVLITFVVKDGKRDALKDVASTLDSAQGQFAIRGDLRQIEYSNQNMETNILRMLNAKERGGLPPFNEQMTFYFSQHNYIIMTLNILEELENRLDDQHIGAKHADEYRSRMATIDAQYREIDTHRNDLQKSVPEMNNAQQELIKLLNDVSKYEKGLTDEAKSFAKHKKRELEIYTGISYGLFGLGWSLGLVGKVFGKTTDDKSDN